MCFSGNTYHLVLAIFNLWDAESDLFFIKGFNLVGNNFVPPFFPYNPGNDFRKYMYIIPEIDVYYW